MTSLFNPTRNMDLRAEQREKERSPRVQASSWMQVAGYGGLDNNFDQQERHPLVFLSCVYKLWQTDMCFDMLRRLNTFVLSLIILFLAS